jgi:hypothetical protein
MTLRLGLDISTSCTGISLIEDERLIRASFVYLSDYGTLLTKANAVKSELLLFKEILSNRELKSITVEQHVLGFRAGLSSSNTIVALARFNGVVSYISGDLFGLEPTALLPVTARKAVGIKSKKGEPIKPIVIAWATSQEPDYPWPTRVVKAGKNKGETVYEKGVEDASDAYVMARAAAALKL